MTWKLQRLKAHRAIPMALALAGVLAGAGASAGASANPGTDTTDGYKFLPRRGEAVLLDCATVSPAACRVGSLPGAPGYDLIETRSGPLVFNGVRIGTLYEKVWRNEALPDLYIFGTKVVVNAQVWNSSGLSFNVNDVFRRALPGRATWVAYAADDSIKPLLAAGRTLQGQGESDEEQPDRDNSWVGFRVDVNAADPDGVISRASPWLMLKTRAPQGIELNPFAIRLLNSEFEDITEAVALFTTGFQPVGLPDPPDDDDDDDDGDDDEAATR